MRTIPLSLMMMCVAGAASGQGITSAHNKTPILIELFTSEGCSSCPPADAWLRSMDSSQPIAGAQIIVLSEHVDYWDHDGWKDPYSLALATDRQAGYVKALGIGTPYTPQVILNGKSELQLSRPQQMSEVFAKAATSSQVPINIGGLSIDGSTLHAHIDVDGELGNHNADIFAAVALDHAESQVLHGENGGRRLTHVAVMQELVKIGRLEKGKLVSHDIQLKLLPGMNSSNLRLIVFAQEPDFGNVLGAAMQSTGSTAK